MRAAPEAPRSLLGREVPATVPGCVRTDLTVAGLLDDPYLDRNEDEQHWVGDSDWRYSTTFAFDASTEADRVDLVFDGLDTVAELSLDGVPLGRTQNMHRGYRFDVTEALRGGGTHELDVTLTAARRYAREVQEAVGTRPGAYAEPFQYIRKMACWDWGPTLVTAGIWKGVRLERWSTGRLAGVRPEVLLDEHGTGQVTVRVELDRAGDRDAGLLLTAQVGGATVSVPVAAAESSAVVGLEVPDVELWWPHDLGDQPLYPLQVTLTDAAGTTLDTWTRRVGFRTVQLRTTPDEYGTPFVLSVNGREIFVKGANWIPDDCFPSRITRTRLQRRAAQAVEANINLLRVWGGGLYESDDFYDVCDELGLRGRGRSPRQRQPAHAARPTVLVLTHAVHDDPLLPDSRGVLSHQKAADGNGKLARGIASHLPDPRDTDDWHYLTQLNQARAVSYGVEHFRSLHPVCTGTIVWQLNDCWPVTSWAAIDGDGRRKPLWYAVRRGFAQRLLTLQPRFRAPAAVLVNDGDATWVGTLDMTRRTP